jgi:hypothetical protein
MNLYKYLKRNDEIRDNIRKNIRGSILYADDSLYELYAINAEIESSIILHKIMCGTFDLSRSKRKNGRCTLCRCATNVFYGEFYLCVYCKEVFQCSQSQGDKCIQDNQPICKLMKGVKKFGDCFIITDFGLIMWYPNKKIIFFHEIEIFNRCYLMPPTITHSDYQCEYCDNAPSNIFRIEVVNISDKGILTSLSSRDKHKFACINCRQLIRQYCWKRIANAVMGALSLDCLIVDVKKYILKIIIDQLVVS